MTEVVLLVQDRLTTVNSQPKRTSHLAAFYGVLPHQCALARMFWIQVGNQPVVRAFDFHG